MKVIAQELSTYYNQTQICTVHRGMITRGEYIYFCPNCKTTYCQKCYEQVIKREGCWSCQDQVGTEDKKERAQIEVIGLSSNKEKKTPKKPLKKGINRKV